MSELWNEYEENSTPEAKIVKDFDKVLAFINVFIVGVFRDFVNVEIVLDIVKFCTRNNLLGRNIK
jgi:5'-deoxynucleotidase YfbR-like HD superfamily hydrolase